MRAAIAALILICGTTGALARSEYRLELTRSSLTAEYCRYREYIDDLPGEHYVTRPCSSLALLATATSNVERVSGLRNLDGRVVRRTIVEERPLEPYAYDADVTTGEVVRRLPMFFRGKPVRIFDPNPIVTLNDPTLQDRNDDSSAVPPAAYRAFELDGIEASGPLRGPGAAMVDRQPPAIAPPDAAGSLLFDRGEDGFEDVNAYFHVDRNQRHLQSLGYVASRQIVPYAIEIDAHALSGGDNSFFLPESTAIGRGSLFFGVGGTDDAEDADLIVHEYGHAILEWISPGTFGGTFASESRAISEGFGDYWAYSAHYAERIASGRDPFCFADWDARCWEDDATQLCGYVPGTDCLRRLDGSRTMAQYERAGGAGVEHRNGAIWSSALREIHRSIVATEGMERGREIADTIVIESLFGTPPHPTFAVMGARLAEADRLLFGGAHIAFICAALSTRGIETACDLRPRGEVTLIPATGSGVAIPENDPAGVVSRLTISDSRIIERLYVTVDIEHPTRGDLRIDLVAPDGTSAMLQQVSFERGPDIRTTFGLTAASAEPLSVFEGRSAAGVWQLVVKDLRARDVGTLKSWGLLIQFEGESPATARPDTAPRQMIPVVAHLYGVGDTTFTSDVRIANPAAEPRGVALVFTPSGTDGRETYSMVRLSLAAGQTVALDDVVAATFNTAGSGSLEIQGEVLVESRTHSRTEDGTVGQQIPARLETATHGDSPLLVVPIDSARASRLNVGITETSGESGVVLLTFPRAETLRQTIRPYSHVQLPVQNATVRIEVESGGARIVAYGSQIDEASDDPTFLPASRPAAGISIAPVIRAVGIGGRTWRSDVWMQSGAPVPQVIELTLIEPEAVTSGNLLLDTGARSSHEDAVARLFGFGRALGAMLARSPLPALIHSRVVTDGMSEFIPLRPVDGGAEQNLLFVENSVAYRTNIGIVAPESATAEITIYDDAGVERERQVVTTPGGAVQIAVTTPVTSGRARVRFLSGRGRAWASLVDNRSGDATWIDGAGP